VVVGPGGDALGDLGVKPIEAPRAGDLAGPGDQSCFDHAQQAVDSARLERLGGGQGLAQRQQPVPLRRPETQVQLAGFAPA
jgi:hypothetical protein